MKLSINNQTFLATTIDELANYLKTYQHLPFAEIWLIEVEKSICLLKNRDWAWLCYFENSLTFHSENPDNQHITETLKFVLANAQTDEYPLAYCYATEIAYKALYYFFEHQAKADFIHWVED